MPPYQAAGLLRRQTLRDNACPVGKIIPPLCDTELLSQYMKQFGSNAGVVVVCGIEERRNVRYFPISLSLFRYAEVLRRERLTVTALTS